MLGGTSAPARIEAFPVIRLPLPISLPFSILQFSVSVVADCDAFLYRVIGGHLDAVVDPSPVSARFPITVGFCSFAPSPMWH